MRRERCAGNARGQEQPGRSALGRPPTNQTVPCRRCSGSGMCSSAAERSMCGAAKAVSTPPRRWSCITWRTTGTRRRGSSSTRTGDGGGKVTDARAERRSAGPETLVDVLLRWAWIRRRTPARDITDLDGGQPLWVVGFTQSWNRTWARSTKLSDMTGRGCRRCSRECSAPARTSRRAECSHPFPRRDRGSVEEAFAFSSRHRVTLACDATEVVGDGEPLARLPSRRILPPSHRTFPDSQARDKGR